MEAYLRALPLTFLPLQGNGDTLQDEGDEILVHLSLFDHWADLYGGRPMLVRLAHYEIGTERLACIGHHHNEATDLVYVPRWILENLACDMTGGTTLLVQQWLEVVPSATHLVLRPLDEVPTGTDLRAAVEAKLDRYHVLETGSLLPLRLDTGEEVTLYVEHTEPALQVALGGEVTVEFLDRATVGAEGEAEAALEAAEERVPTPIPEAPAILHPGGAGAGAGATEQTAEERMATIRESWLQRLASMRKDAAE